MNYPSVGFIGLGSMGLPIASNILNSGFNIYVHNRTRQKETHKFIKNAIPCSSPSQIAEFSNLIILCLSDEVAIDNVLFGNQGVVDNIKKGCLILDCSTISASKSIEVANKLKNYSALFVDAPVTGGTEGAKEGSLTMFCGSNQTTLLPILPIVNTFTDTIHFFDKIGNGQKVKAINQILVAGTSMAVAEALSLGQSQDLPMDRVVKSLLKGAGSCWPLLHRSTNMLKDKYPLGFKLSLHYKDLNIAINSAEELGLELRITKLIRDLEALLIKKGYGSKDISVIKKSLD